MLPFHFMPKHTLLFKKMEEPDFNQDVVILFMLGNLETLTYLWVFLIFVLKN